MNKKLITGAASVVLASCVGLGIALPAKADVADALEAVRENRERGERPSMDATEEERDAANDARRTALVTALAAELDVDEDALTSALVELRAEHEAERGSRPPVVGPVFYATRG